MEDGCIDGPMDSGGDWGEGVVIRGGQLGAQSGAEGAHLPRATCYHAPAATLLLPCCYRQQSEGRRRKEEATNGLNICFKELKLTYMSLSTDFWGPASNFGIPVAAVLDITRKDPEV